MRISVSGTKKQGKSTLIGDFLERWDMYSTPKKTYRDLLSEKKLPNTENTNKETQWAILNCMIDEIQKYGREDKVIFDRCPLDNLVYTLWGNAKGISGIDNDFVRETIKLVKESLRFIDIIFFIPITKQNNIVIDEDSKEFIEEIDYIFKSIQMDYFKNSDSSFFISDDKPAIIEIFGSRKERIQSIKFYLDVDGDPIQDEQSKHES